MDNMNNTNNMSNSNTDEHVIKQGIYRHYKGNEYEVIGMAKHSETLEPMVVYRALYGDYELWVRPASMWTETVETQNQKVQRFTYIRECKQK